MFKYFFLYKLASKPAKMSSRFVDQIKHDIGPDATHEQITQYMIRNADAHGQEFLTALANVIASGLQSTDDTDRRRCINLCNWLIKYGNTHFGDGEGKTLLQNLVGPKMRQGQ